MALPHEWMRLRSASRRFPGLGRLVQSAWVSRGSVAAGCRPGVVRRRGPGRAGPVPFQRLRPRSTYDGPQHPRDDKDVVGVTGDRDEVGHEVDGQSEIGQQQPEPPPDPARQRAVSRETANQAQNIGQQPDRVAQTRRIARAAASDIEARLPRPARRAPAPPGRAAPSSPGAAALPNRSAAPLTRSSSSGGPSTLKSASRSARTITGHSRESTFIVSTQPPWPVGLDRRPSGRRPAATTAGVGVDAHADGVAAAASGGCRTARRTARPRPAARGDGTAGRSSSTSLIRSTRNERQSWRSRS